MKSRSLRAVARIVLAPALVVALLVWADSAAVAARLAAADASALVAALALSCAASVVSALRWRALVRWLGTPVSSGWAIRTYFQAMAVNALLPGAVVGGDLYRVHQLALRRMPWAPAMLSVAVDRVGGLWMLVVLGLGAAAWGLVDGGLVSALRTLTLPTTQAWVPLALGGALLLLPLALLRGLDRPLRGGAAGRWTRRLRPLLQRPRATQQYGWQLLWSTAVQVLSIGALAAGAIALDLTLPWWAFAAAAVPIFLLAALPVSFGGWGTREAGAVLAFGALGVAPDQALGAALLYGVWALLQGIMGAALWLAPAAAQAPPGAP